jgi:succinate-semialdehyde dehydrogenase/glutarate-semialdehyde dehydrogenase
MFQTINPFNQQVLIKYEPLEGLEINAMVEKAQEAFEKWKRTSFEYRSGLLKNLAQLLKINARKYASIITKEMGKPIVQSVAEIQKCAWVCEYYAENAADFLSTETVKTGGSRSWVSFEPLGVIFGIMPWNYPFWQVLRFAAPTLMAGNTVMVKHAPNTFGTGELINELFLSAGFQEGVYSNLIIEVEKVQHIIKHEHIKAVTLTGSEKAGASVASIAAGEIKKSVLELGGSNAFIVMEDAEIVKSVDLGFEARMQNNGQSCIAAKRFLVHKEVFDEYVRCFQDKIDRLHFGDPLDENTTIGPLARIDLAEKLESQVQKSIAMGAKLLCGGRRSSAFYEPTILTNVQPGMPAFDEELFGPVAAFTSFTSIEKAIRLSNQNDYGLGVSVCCQDAETMLPLISEFREGAVFLNEKVMSDPRLPFGGIKKSGFGRELGMQGIKEFVNTKTVFIA